MTKHNITKVHNLEPQKGYKHTSIGWIPENWDIKELDKLAIKIGSGITPTGGDKVYIKKGRPFLRSQNVGWGVLLLDEVAFISDKIHLSFESTELKENDVLLNITGASIGRSAIVDKRVIGGNVNQHVCIIRANQNEVISIFLSNFLLSPNGQNLINSYQAGGNRQGLNFEQIRTFKIPIPPLAEQKAIANLLSTWDKAIINCQLLIKNCQLRKKWLMQHLLTGKKRLTGFNGKWEYKRISSIADEVSIKNKEDKELTVLSCTKYDGLVPSLEYFGRKIFADDLTTYKVVPKHHFAYATNHIEEGSIGYQNQFEEGLISPMYTVFKTNGKMNDDYLFRLLKTNNYILEYQKRIEGSINRRGGLRWNEFSKITIPIPSLVEQAAIANILLTVDKEIDIQKQKLKALEEQKKGLMQVLLTGKKRIHRNIIAKI